MGLSPPPLVFEELDLLFDRRAAGGAPLDAGGGGGAWRDGTRSKLDMELECEAVVTMSRYSASDWEVGWLSAGWV